MQVYSLNKAAYLNLPSLSYTDLKKSSILPTFLSNHEGKYYMLLNNETHYYTLFTYKDE